MKSLILIALTFCFAIQGKGQNEPELVGTFSSVSSVAKFVYIDHDMPKLVLTGNEGIELYNLDLTLFLDFDYPEADTNSYNRLYISRSLFDCDTTNIEYMSVGGTFENSYIRIFREDGTTFFNLEGFQLLNTLGVTENATYLASDASGSYISFVSSFFGSEGLLYRFCGQVPRPLAREMDGTVITGIMEQGNNNGFDAYPNPAREIIKFEYDLQGHKKANLQLFNTSGQLMKEMMLGQAFDFIRLNISDLEQGTYIARITTDDGFELSEKFVKVD